MLDSTGKHLHRALTILTMVNVPQLASEKWCEIETTYIIDTRTVRFYINPGNVFGYQWTKDQQQHTLPFVARGCVWQLPLKTYFWKVAILSKGFFIGTTTDAKNSSTSTITATATNILRRKRFLRE
jgi:hypothetical protein